MEDRGASFKSMAGRDCQNREQPGQKGKVAEGGSAAAAGLVAWPEGRATGIVAGMMERYPSFVMAVLRPDAGRQ